MSDLDDFISRYREALDIFCKGDATPSKKIWSHSDDVTLANPFGPPVHGWAAVEKTLEHAASLFRDGEFPAFEVVSRVETPDLAYQVDLEPAHMKIGGSNEMSSVNLRVTTIFRREDGEWKIIHRHADPITTPQGADTITQN